MVDGTLDPHEWDDALLVTVQGALLRIKQSGEFVFFAVEVENSVDCAVDLYLSPAAGEIYDLHASAKLGERKLEGHTWPEWHWWNNSGWVANTSRVESFDKRSFLPTPVREFQIRRSRFPGAKWRIMLELMTPAEPRWNTAFYPAGATPLVTNNWLTFQFQ